MSFYKIINFSSQHITQFPTQLKDSSYTFPTQILNGFTFPNANISDINKDTNLYAELHRNVYSFIQRRAAYPTLCEALTQLELKYNPEYCTEHVI